MPYEIIDNDVDIEGGKDTLLLTLKQGPFVKPCPCSNGSVSCGYYNINVMEGCLFDCSYCILQLYLKNKPITIYVNFEDLFNELDNITSNNKFFRVGPGELADSLCLEEYTDIAKKLILYFNDKNALLEIKTKDHNIDSLLELDHRQKTVISFSVNPYIIAKSDEKGASSLDQRLNSAQTAQKHGYFNAFHFDPVIIFDDWEKHYKELIYKLKETVIPENVKWISIGLLRFPIQLKNIILKNHPESEILNGELLLGDDGKMRYFIKIRQYAYKFIYENLKNSLPDVPIYFCMERPYVWNRYDTLKNSLKTMNRC